MKKLWITVIHLSIFVFSCAASEEGQETLVPNRGAGACWRPIKSENGFEVFEFIPSTNKCGWFTVFQRPHDTAGSRIGYNGYIKISNILSPKNAFYLGSTTPQRSLKFGDKAVMACFICQPDSTNCLPNDPVRSVECFTGNNKIVCDTQVNCSDVVEITECYSEAKGIFTQVYNDLKLCDAPDKDLFNFSGAGAGAYQAQDDASSSTRLAL